MPEHQELIGALKHMKETRLKTAPDAPDLFPMVEVERGGRKLCTVICPQGHRDAALYVIQVAAEMMACDSAWMMTDAMFSHSPVGPDGQPWGEGGMQAARGSDLVAEALMVYGSDRTGNHRYTIHLNYKVRGDTIEWLEEEVLEQGEHYKLAGFVPETIEEFFTQDTIDVSIMKSDQPDFEELRERVRTTPIEQFRIESDMAVFALLKAEGFVVQIHEPASETALKMYEETLGPDWRTQWAT